MARTNLCWIRDTFWTEFALRLDGLHNAYSRRVLVSRDIAVVQWIIKKCPWTRGSSNTQGLQRSPKLSFFLKIFTVFTLRLRFRVILRWTLIRQFSCDCNTDRWWSTLASVVHTREGLWRNVSACAGFAWPQKPAFSREEFPANILSQTREFTERVKKVCSIRVKCFTEERKNTGRYVHYEDDILECHKNKCDSLWILTCLCHKINTLTSKQFYLILNQFPTGLRLTSIRGMGNFLTSLKAKDSISSSGLE